jgi:hypothetical protein
LFESTLHILHPPVTGYVQPLQTDLTERHSCTACGWVHERVRPDPPLYRIRFTKRGKQPGMFFNSQPTRATLLHDRLVGALREEGLLAGLALLPAQVEPYATRYWVAWSPTRLLTVAGPMPPGDVRVDCASCGGLWMRASLVSRVTFARPGVEADWYDTNLQREPSVTFAVSSRVRAFFESAAAVRLLAPSKLFPAPTWETAAVE